MVLSSAYSPPTYTPPPPMEAYWWPPQPQPPQPPPPYPHHQPHPHLYYPPQDQWPQPPPLNASYNRTQQLPSLPSPPWPPPQRPQTPTSSPPPSDPHKWVSTPYDPFVPSVMVSTKSTPQPTNASHSSHIFQQQSPQSANVFQPHPPQSASVPNPNAFSQPTSWNHVMLPPPQNILPHTSHFQNPNQQPCQQYYPDPYHTYQQLLVPLYHCSQPQPQSPSQPIQVAHVPADQQSTVVQSPVEQRSQVEKEFTKEAYILNDFLRNTQGTTALYPPYPTTPVTYPMSQSTDDQASKPFIHSLSSTASRTALVHFPKPQSQPTDASRRSSLMPSVKAATKPSFFSRISLNPSTLHPNTLLPFPPLDSLEVPNSPLHKSQPSDQFAFAPKHSPPLDAFEFLHTLLHKSSASISLPISVLQEFSMDLEGKVQIKADCNVRMGLGRPKYALKIKWLKDFIGWS